MCVSEFKRFNVDEITVEEYEPNYYEFIKTWYELIEGIVSVIIMLGFLK